MRKKKKTKKEKKTSFSNSKLTRLLLAVFKEYETKSLNYKQLSKKLGVTDFRVKIQILDIVNVLAKDGFLEEVSRGSFKLLNKLKKIKTVIKKATPKGVFADIDSEKEVFIERALSCFVLPGDTVEVVVFNKKKKKYLGKVDSVLNRVKNSFTGIIDNNSSNYFFVADDKRVFFDVFLPKKTVKKEYLNKKILVKIDKWDDSFKNPFGKVVRVIGDIKNHKTNLDSVIYDYGFENSFSKKVSLESKKIINSISKEEISRRLDLRKITTFTIDPKNAKDFDDALSVKKISSKNWEIGVHIADVSHYVKDGSSIDEEASKRATSVYLVDRVVPMLPEFLSNDICSLKPNVDRLAFSVLFKITTDGEVLDYKIKKTVIHSNYRFTYENAEKSLNKKNAVFHNEILLLNRIAKKLRAKRFSNGSINFENKEVSFVLDSLGNPLDVIFKPFSDTNKLIEEFMLLANKTVSKHINSVKNPNPFIYRVHDLPDREKITNLYSVVKNFGYSINNQNGKTLSKSLNILLKKIKGSEHQQMIETLIVRSMAKAVYSTNNSGHYGLSFKYYSHFTSPIRRYPDLITHRLLFSCLENKKTNYTKDFLDNICYNSTEKEKNSSSAERESIKLMQVKYLSSKIGKIYDGIISGVTEWGIYVEIIKNKCEGLVKINTIKDDHYFYDKSLYSIIGYNNKKKYQLGKKIKIKIVAVDYLKKQVDFSLI